MIDTKTRQILKLLEDSYYGTGGFEFCADDSSAHQINATGDGSYIIKHHRECLDDYFERVRLAYYLNYVAPVIDSHVAPIFRQQISREVKAGAQSVWDAFAADSTGGGVSIADLMRDAAYPAKRDGIHILALAVPKEKTETVADQIQVRPYIYQVFALDIVDLVRDRFGNISKLQHGDTIIVDGEEKPVVRELTATGWRVLDGEAVIESGDWTKPYTFAPCVEISPGMRVRGKAFPRSEFVAVARANHRLFNLQSELDEVFRSQAFSILTYPSTDLKDLTVGANNALGYNPESRMKPEYISPGADPSKMYMEQFDRIVREIYRMSLLASQTGSTNKMQTQNPASGIALRIDREALDSALCDFAKTLQTAEEQLVKLWSWATGINADATIVYPCEFTLQDLGTELQPLLDTFAAVSAIAPPAMKVAILKRVAALILESDEVSLEEVQKALEQALQDGSHDDGVLPTDGNAEDNLPPNQNQTAA